MVTAESTITDPTPKIYHKITHYTRKILQKVSQHISEKEIKGKRKRVESIANAAQHTACTSCTKHIAALKSTSVNHPHCVTTNRSFLRGRDVIPGHNVSSRPAVQKMLTQHITVTHYKQQARRDITRVQLNRKSQALCKFWA